MTTAAITTETAMTTPVMSHMYGNTTMGHRNYTQADLTAITDERAITLLPAMLVLGSLMIIGIAGNSLVCYIFCCRLKSGTQNFLIVCLAVLDLLSCAIAIPNEIADMRFYFDFSSEGACKIMRFINTFCAIGSIFTLIVIAIDRYRKICKPFSGQLHMSHVRLSLIPVFGAAIFFSWPAFIMYGLRTMETGIPGLYGRDCSTPDGMNDTIYPLLYNVVLFLCFIILAVTLIILYSFVLRETKRHNRYLKRNSDFNLPHSSQYSSEETHSNGEMTPGHAASSSLPPNSDKTTIRTIQSEYGSNSTVNTTVEIPASQPELVNMTRLADSDQEESHCHISGTETTLDKAPSPYSEIDNKTCPSTDYPLTSEQTNLHTSPNSSISGQRSILSSSKGTRKKELRIAISDTNSFPAKIQSSIKIRRRFKSKTTIIAFLVTLVFILSFLPHLSLQVAKMLHKGFDYNLQGSALVAYNLFLRSYFINSVSNPIIYGALNPHFSKEVKILVKKICKKS